MKKIDRRDYLIRMGAGALGIVGAASPDILGQKKSRPPKRRVRDKRTGIPPTTNSILRWPIMYTPPNLNSPVTAIFWGLIGFCYKTPSASAPVCEVGFHPGGGHHKLDIKAYKKVDGSPICDPVPLAVPPKITTMNLKIVGFGTAPEFFQKDDLVFDRYRVGGDYEYDFRWLPDLDGADFYPEPYGKNKYFGPRLYVSNGTFYTRLRTGSTFKLVDARTNQDIRRFGHVARYMATALSPTGSDLVRFEVNGRSVKDFSRQDGVSYQIVFKNECDDCSLPDPNDPHDETRRNDFHFNRKVVKVPSNRTQYGLTIETSGTSSPNFCPGDRLNDEAPCMGSGYGQTNGFPSP